MIFKPAQLGLARLDAHELEEDKKACRKIGPCGVGKKALYLNSFYIDRRYYLPYGSITRVFKRVAMSSGGFTGKGMFASMAYLVVEYDGGKQKQCNFKDERDVDTLLALLAKEQPQIKRLSAAGEQVLEKKEAEKGRPQTAGALQGCPAQPDRAEKRPKSTWRQSPRSPKSSARPSAGSVPSSRASRCISMWPSSSACSAWWRRLTASTRCSPTTAITAFTLPCLALRPSSSSPATT